MRQILLASKEPQERSPLLRDVIPDSPPQHRIASLKCVEKRTQGYLTPDFEDHLAASMGQRSQMLRKYNADHADDLQVFPNRRAKASDKFITNRI